MIEYAGYVMLFLLGVLLSVLFFIFIVIKRHLLLKRFKQKSRSSIKEALSFIILSESISAHNETAQMSRDLYRDFQKMFSDTKKFKKPNKK